MNWKSITELPEDNKCVLVKDLNNTITFAYFENIMEIDYKASNWQQPWVIVNTKGWRLYEPKNCCCSTLNSAFTIDGDHACLSTKEKQEIRSENSSPFPDTITHWTYVKDIIK